jgi:hypothetical protein
METISEIFAASQSATNLHKANVKRIINLLSKKDTQVENLLYLLSCIDKVFLYPRTNVYIDHVSEFIAKLVVAFDDEILTVCVKHMCSRLSSPNKIVRQRICSILTLILAEVIAADAALSDDIIDHLSKNLRIRLNDKIPTVRLWALKAVRFLQDPQEHDDLVTNEMLRLMSTDTSVAVRLEAVQQINLFKEHYPQLCDRLRDVKSEVSARHFYPNVPSTSISDRFALPC